MAIIHQILPNLEYGDAIGNYAIVLRRVLRAMGHRSRIFARFIHPRMWWYGNRIGAARRLGGREDVTWIYHYSTGSEVTRMVREFRGPVILIYHNITPPSLTMQSDGLMASRSHEGWSDLKTLTDLPKIALGVSEYNRMQLSEIGFRNTGTLPIVLDHAEFERAPDRSILRRYDDGWVNFLTVSRVLPHKKIEDAIKVFRYYQEYINPSSRLFVVGDSTGADEYRERLIEMCRSFGVANVIFTGRVRMRELLAYYKLARVYLCMSEHEGFCVPLLECMHLGVPIIAYKSTAISETLGDAGILFREKRFDEMAEMAHLLITDEDLRARVIRKQKERALDFREDYLAAALNRAIAGQGT